MTHFVAICVCDDEDKLAEMLAPYDENAPGVPHFEYLAEAGTYDELEAMQNHYKTKNLKELVKHMEEWNGNLGEIRDGRLGSYSTYNENSQWDWYVVGGRWENVVPGDQCLAEEVSVHFKEYLPSVVVDRKGWHSEKTWGWWGTSTPIDWNHGIVKQKLEEHKGKNVFVVDFHI